MATHSNVIKPKVLILGGSGFIGRNLTFYLTEHNLVSHIRIVDKVPPQTAWLNTKHSTMFSSSLVDFYSANLINTVSCHNAFMVEEGQQGWDFVINCACETKPGQTNPVYQEGVLKLSLNCANESAQSNVKRYIELSTGSVYSSDVKDAQKEDSLLDPWTCVGKWKVKVEEQLQSIPNLSYTIIRPAIVYGLGDRTGLTPRLLIGAVYKRLQETMKLLWSGTLPLNTVHVTDVSRAIWHLCNLSTAKGEIYNVVDKGNSTQEKISEIIADIFNISVDYLGTLRSTIIKTDLSSLVEDVNDKHMTPWADACQISGIENTPLSPYMDEELLLCKSMYLDGIKLLSTGFEYCVPELTKEGLLEVLDDYVIMNVFPKSLI